MKRRLVIALVISGTILLPVTSEAGRRSREPATLAELATRPAPIDTTEPVNADLALAAESYQTFLAIPDADPTLRVEALRRLGDLRLAEAEALRARDGTDDARADAVTRDAMAAYEQLLAEQPAAGGAEVALYQLARAHEALGEPERAMKRLDELVAKHPGGAHYAEAQFRRGETLFAEQQYAGAESAYSAVLANDAAGEFGQQALYKLAWSQFKQSRDEDSSASFLRLLDGLLVSEGRLQSDADLSRAGQELAADSMHALAITFAANDGPASLQAALERHGRAAYESKLYRALGDLYVEKERYQDAAEAYRAFARRQPMDPDAPLLLVAATEAYAKGGFQSLVLDGKRQLVEEYGPRSAFWKAQGEALDPAVSSAVRSSLLDLARHHHALAQQGGGAAERAAAVRWYRDFLEGFDDAPEAPATRLLLADLLFESEDFPAAALEYERAAYSYPVNAESGRAGYAALVSYDRAEAQAPEAAKASIRANAIESSLRFADAFPGHEQTPAVLTRTTKALFDAGDRERAESVAQRVLALGPRADSEQQLVAWTVLAHTWFDSGRFAEAERGYGEVVRRLPPGDPLQTEAVERLAASVYRQAEARKSAGDLRGAVAEFLRVGVVAPTATSRAAAEFDAATLLAEIGAWDEAATVLEQFRRDHAGNELESRVTRDLATAYLNSGRPREAAAEYERIAATSTESVDVRRAARWQAAVLAAENGDLAGARRNFAAYVSEHPAPLAAAIEARQELARLAGAAGDTTDRRRWLGELIAADANAGSERTARSQLLAADAALELARPLDAATRALRLTVPLDRSLALRKRSFEDALSAYARAENYGIAQVATPATYAMAELYRDFGRALLASERPHDLAAEELEQYDVLLEEQAFPFEEKAISLHERNARRAAGGTWDEWVRASYAALAQMAPGRYARTEMPSHIDAAMASFAAVTDAEANDPFGAALFNQLGIAYRQSGRFADARAAYERAAQADPTQPEAHCNLAILQDLYLGEPRGALPNLERCQSLATEADQQPGVWVAELKTRLGQVERTAETKP